MRYGYDFTINYALIPKEQHEYVLKASTRKAADLLGQKILEEMPPTEQDFYEMGTRYRVNVFVISEEKKIELFELARRMEDKRLYNLLLTC